MPNWLAPAARHRLFPACHEAFSPDLHFKLILSDELQLLAQTACEKDRAQPGTNSCRAGKTGFRRRRFSEFRLATPQLSGIEGFGNARSADALGLWSSLGPASHRRISV